MLCITQTLRYSREPTVSRHHRQIYTHTHTRARDGHCPTTLKMTVQRCLAIFNRYLYLLFATEVNRSSCLCQPLLSHKQLINKHNSLRRPSRCWLRWGLAVLCLRWTRTSGYFKSLFGERLLHRHYLVAVGATPNYSPALSFPLSGALLFSQDTLSGLDTPDTGRRCSGG